jgi:hypothetical protein
MHSFAMHGATFLTDPYYILNEQGIHVSNQKEHPEIKQPPSKRDSEREPIESPQNPEPIEDPTIQKPDPVEQPHQDPPPLKTNA